MPVAADAPPSSSAEVVLLSWRVHRLREDARPLPWIAAGYGAAFALWWLLFPRPLALFLPVVALTSALAEYLFPISYRLTDRGAHVTNGFNASFLSWSDVKRATVGSDGIHLSPLARAGSPLDPFRGVRLRVTPENRDAVTETVQSLWRRKEPPA